MKKVMMIAFAMVVVAGCAGTKKDADAVVVKHRILAHGAYSERETASNIIITSQGKLDEIYKELLIDSIPSVNFDENNVVALFMGRKSTGGYSITVNTVHVFGSEAQVNYITSAPDGMATMALSSPYCIAAIPKTGRVIFFDESTKAKK